MARKRTKKQTLSEFRAWLNGVEELQPEDWAPNAAQWKLIREKIDSIAEPKADVDTDALAKAIEGISNNQRPPAPQPWGAPQGNPMAAGIPPAPPAPAGVPAGPVEAASGMEQTPASVNLPPAPPVDIVEAAKPKDTAEDGKYESSFI